MSTRPAAPCDFRVASRVLRGSLAALPFLTLPLVTLGLTAPAAAQEMQVAKPRRASIAYFGESITNPGAILGYEATFYYRRGHELFGGAHIGGYNSANPSYYGLLIYIEGGYRLNFSVGFFLEARVGLGYVNVNHGSVQTLSDGSMVTGPNVSGNYLTPIGLAGLGWDLLPRTRVPISLFADVGGMGRYAQGEDFSGGLVLTTGLAYQFGTTRPRTAETMVPPVPPAEAPPNLDGPNSPPGVTSDLPVYPAPGVGPGVGPGVAPGPLAPDVPADPPWTLPEPPQLPPPPTVPATP